jgi:diaminopimelate decarboxylase
MSSFHYQNHQLYVEQVPLAHIAQQWGTPTYVYSLSALLANYQAFTNALQNQAHLICYAVKANSNIALLNCLAKQGSGFDIVSLGELHRVLAAGGDVRKIVFSGVGKGELDIRNALDIGIACFNVESAPELDKIQAIAKRLNKPASISIRVNPDVDAKTHPYISTGLKIHKFGVDIDNAIKMYQHAQSLSHIKIHGIDCHIGSQITAIEPFLQALDQVLALIDQLKKSGIEIAHLNLGGGLGVRYQDETPPDISTYCAAIVQHLKGRDIKLILEPGRALVANTGILLTQVEYIKQGFEKKFAIVDAAMNDLIRPSLYDAWHHLLPVTEHQDINDDIYDVVGPVCETGDFIAKQRALKIKDQDLIAIMSAGAYGFSMSSNYNSRPRAAEIAVKGDSARVVRDRETFSDLFKHEHLL